ncbi:2Fe-2S iron-sulfur cluster-binding protein [Nevskia soli]|uniref:2Fe-2S iron-sulfur cluster-binding protein n=1 Tax=Nevskia soli TaxID=418856 RepID=UPI0004A6D707
MSARTVSPCSVTLRQTGETYVCAAGETLLQGMLKLGRRGIPVGCVNGGCGVCKVKVMRGRCLKVGAVSRQHVTAEEEARGVTLACRAAPQTDVEVEVIGKMQRGFVNLIVGSGPAAG